MLVDERVTVSLPKVIPGDLLTRDLYSGSRQAKIEFMRKIRGGPLYQFSDEIITPITRVSSPHLPIYFQPFIR